MRKILFSVIVLLALLLAAEVGVTLLSQKGLERAMRSQYELPESLEVSINSFPFLLSLARNHLAELRFSWEGEIEYMVEEGMLASMPYSGWISIYDVELNMPSLLRGRLEVRDVSRLEGAITAEVSSINDGIGITEGGFYVEDGRLYAGEGNEKTRFKVKVLDSRTVAIGPYNAYTGTEGTGTKPDSQVYTVTINALPFGAELKNASLDDANVVLEISIPMWEGYL